MVCFYCQKNQLSGKVIVENLFVRTHLETLGGKHYNISNNSLEMFLGKQVITSNLHAKDFLVSSMAKLNISGELYTFENLSNYWSKNDNQVSNEQTQKHKFSIIVFSQFQYILKLWKGCLFNTYKLSL